MTTSDVQIANVRLDQIRFHAHNVRRDLGDLRGLAESIRRFGVMQPVVLEHRGDHFRLRAGHRRVAAARQAGLFRIPAVVHRVVLDDEEWLAHSVQENVMRRDLNAQERTDTVRRLREIGCTWQGIADTFGVSIGAVQKYANPDPPGARKAPARKVATSTVRSLARSWREYAATHPVTVEQLLDAMDRLSETATLAAALPGTDTQPPTTVKDVA